MKIQNGFSLKPQAPEVKNAEREQQLKEAAKMYETHFLNHMVKAMRQTVNREEGMIKPNFAEKIFTEQLDNQYVDAWANKGGVGLADMIYDQISERYLAHTQKQFGRAAGALPIAPKVNGMKPTDPTIQMKMLPPPDGAKLNYRFELKDPTGQGGKPADAVAPFAGKVIEAARLADNWNVIRLDHGQGVESEMTFPGRLLTDSANPTEVQAGQVIGELDSGRPVLAWK